jgi:TatD DNase family protein
LLPHLPDNCPVFPNLAAMNIPFTDAHTHFRYPQNGEVKFVRNAFLLKTAGHLPYNVCCGIHPWFVREQWRNDFDLLKQLAAHHNVAAIGECGLDYLRPVPKALQHEAFAAQIALANELSKPLVLHIVKAYHDLPQFLKAAKTPVVLHAYNGSSEQTQQLQNYNVLFSIGTRMLLNPEKLEEILQNIPHERLLFETDTRRSGLQQLYSKAAQYYKCEEAELRKQVFRNFAATFLLNEPI